MTLKEIYKNVLSMKIGKDLEKYGFRNDMTIEEAKEYIKDLKFILPKAKASISLDSILKLFEDEYQINTPQIYYHEKSYPTNVYLDSFIDSKFLIDIKIEYNENEFNNFVEVCDEIFLKLNPRQQLCFELRYIKKYTLEDMTGYLNVTTITAVKQIIMYTNIRIRILYPGCLNMQQISKEFIYTDIYSIPIHSLFLSDTAYMRLYRGGINTFIDLYKIYLHDKYFNTSILSSIKNVGKAYNIYIVETLENFIELPAIKDEVLKFKESFINDVKNGTAELPEIERSMF